MTVTMEIMDGLQTELEKRYPGRGDSFYMWGLMASLADQINQTATEEDKEALARLFNLTLQAHEVLWHLVRKTS